MTTEHQVLENQLSSPAQALAAIDQLLVMAKQYMQGGNHLKAQECYELILTHVPEHDDANFQLGQLSLLQGEQLTALTYFERAIQASPTTDTYWSAYIAILQSLGDDNVVAEAIKLREQFFSSDINSNINSNTAPAPDQTEDNSSLTASTQNRSSTKLRPLTSKKSVVFSEGVDQLVKLYEKGAYKEVERLANKLTKKNPQHGFAWRFLGIALLELNRKEESLTSMQRALRILPDDPIAHFNLALAYTQMKNFSSAEQHYKQAIQLNPEMLEAYNNLGNLLAALSKFEEAESCFRDLIRYKPEFALAHLNLANVLKQRARLPEAKAEAILAASLAPDMADAHNCLGGILFLLKELDLALVHLQKAVELRPDFASAYNNLGTVYVEKRQYIEAKASFNKALHFDPLISVAYRSLGILGNFLAEPIADSERLLRRAIELDPKDHGANTALLFLLSEAGTLTAKELFQEHLLFAKRFESALISHWPVHTNDKTSDRRLRIGFVSGDFYNHAVATFIEPILKHLCKYDLVELYAYYNNQEEDQDTARLKSYFSSWEVIQSKNDDEVFKQILEHKIDILVDLSGHTSMNRLTLFARKPAPIQVTWIGYPGTTGLSAMDYFIGDHYLLPNGQFDSLFSEKIANIPCSAPFNPSTVASDVAPLPAIEKGYIVFGSFNRIGKINDATIALWSKLMARLPTSKILLGSMPQTLNPSAITDKFAAHGISSDRISFYGRSNMTDYLNLYHRIDMCLDTFPYNGGTTTHHGLWMGVPTLSLIGDTVPSRSAAGIMGQVGLDDFLATSEEEFIHKGLFWCENLDLLSTIRSTLRTRSENSIKCHPELLTDSVYRAFRYMWERWCNNLPACSFDLAELDDKKKQAD